MFPALCFAQTLPTLNLVPGMEGDEVGSYIRYETGYEGEMDYDILMGDVGNFQSLETDNIHFGVPDGKILILLRVKNQENKSGNWILTTGRGSLKYFKFYELSSDHTELVIDGNDTAQVKNNLQSYLSFSHEIVLGPYEEKVYAIHFEPENLAYIPIKIKTNGSFFKSRTVNLANALHAEGYTTIYWLFDKPLLSLAFGDLVKCAFVAAISQVARTFIRTRENFPRTDKVLLTLIFICFVVCLMEIGVRFYSSEMKSFLHATSWLILLVISLYLPIVAVITVRQLGVQYWPLIPAWGALCAFIIYAVIATIGSLMDKLEITEKAQKLADQRATALATIHDQNSLIHATGHDSRQVMFALNSAITHLDEMKSDNVELSNMLKASADYLNDIISVTMSGANMMGDGSPVISLGQVKTDALSIAVEKIYAHSFQEKGLYYKTYNYTPASIISDNAVLMRVVSNVVSNSLKFTERGGVELSAAVAGDRYVMTITDTGCGMSESMIDTLNSQDFLRTKENDFFDGSGSGLRFSIDMVSALGGQIIFQSVKKEYTQVVIELPYMDIGPAINFEQLTDLEAGLNFTDVDNDDFTHLPSDARGKVAVTYDNSSIMRSRLSHEFNLIILKPLHREVLKHPLIQSLL